MTEENFQDVSMTVEDGRKRGFFIVDNELIQDERLDHFDFAVYSVLLFHENRETGACYPAYATFKKYLKLSRDRVMKSIKKLEMCGYITVIQKTGYSNHYVINDAKTAFQSNQSAKTTGGESDIQDPDQSLRTTSPRRSELPPPVVESDSNNTKINNTKINKKKEKDMCKAQNTLFNIKAEEKKTTSVKKKMTQAETASEKIASAKESQDWSKVTDRDFTYYYIEKHNELFKPISFDRFSSVGIIRDSFINRYKIERDEVCKYIDEILRIYSTHPKKWDALTFNMIDKNMTLMNELYRNAQIKLRAVPEKFATISSSRTEKSNTDEFEVF